METKDLIKELGSITGYKKFKEYYNIEPMPEEELKTKFPDLYNDFYKKEEQQKNVISSFIDGVKKKAGEFIGDTFKYFTTTKPADIGKDAVDTTASIFQGLNIGLKKATSTIDRLLLGASFSPEIKKQIQEERGLDPEQIKKEEEELKKNKKPLSKFVFDLSQWFAPSITTAAASTALGASPFITATIGVSPPLIQALSSSKAILTGLDFVKDTQLLYNPAEHEGKDDLKTRVVDASENFLSGVVFYGGTKVVKKVGKPIVKKLWEGVSYPMRLINKVIEDKQVKVTEDFLKQNTAAFWGLTSRLEEVPTKEIISILKGEKGITDEVRYFFTTPEWQNVIKKYGADFNKYPEIIRLRRSLFEPLQTTIEAGKPSVEIKDIKGLLPENILFKKLEESFLNDANSFSSPEYILKDIVSGKIPLEQTNKIIKELENQGYKVNREKILETMGNLVKNIREVEDWQLAVMSNEVVEQQLNSLDVFRKPLMLYKKIYNLVFEKKPDLVRVGEAYNKAAKKYGYPSLDEIAQGLRDRGFDIQVGNFEEELLNIVNSIESKTSIPKPPKEYNYVKDLFNSVKPKGEAVSPDAPYRVAKKELDKIINVKKNIVAGEEKKAEDVLKKVKDNVIKEGLEKEVKEAKKDVFSVIQENINTTGGLKPTKISPAQFEILFGRYEPNKINEYSIDFINKISNKNTSPFEIFSSLNNVLKETIKNNAYFLENTKLAEADKSPIKSALASIFSPLRYTHSLALGFTGTPQARQVLALADNWVVTQENVGNAFSRFLNYIRENKFLTEKLNIIDDVIKKYGDDVLKPDFVDNRFTAEEMIKVKEYIKSTKEILNTINIFRVATGRMPIPERTDYVAPKRLADFILNALAEKKDIVKPDVRMYFKRELERVGFGGIFSDNLETAWGSYIKVAKKLISKYQYEFLTTQAGINNTILDKTADKILSRFKYAAGVQPKDTIVSEVSEFFGGVSDLFKGFSNYIQEKFLGKEKYVRIPVNEQVLKELGMTENLKNYFPEVFEKGYFEYSKDIFKESTANLSSVAKSMIYALTLGMNSSFTILNAFQEYVVGAPLIGVKDVGVGYGKTILNPVLKVFGLGFDAKRLENLGKFYDLMGKGQTVFIDDKEIIINPLLKLLTFNVSLTEEKLIRPAGIQSFLAHISKTPISQELKERMAIEFSKEINFTSSRLYKPTLSRIPGIGILFMFTQYPDNLLSRLELATKMAFSDKESIEFYKYLLTKTNASKEEFDLFLKEIASRQDSSLWRKAVRAGNLGLVITSLIVGGRMLGELFFDAANLLSTKFGLSEKPEDKEEYLKSKESFASSFQKNISPLESTQGAPIVSFSRSLADAIIKNQGIQMNTLAFNYFKTGVDLTFKLPAIAVSILNGKEEEARALFDDIQESFFTAISPTQVSRLIDAYDSYNKGYLLSRTKKGRIQYTLKEGENPLQVFLFGRGGTRGYQELQELKKIGDEATTLRNTAWDYYERYLETGDDKYYTLFNKYSNELESKFGERISLYDLIKRKKEFKKGLTSPERYLKSQPKETRKELQIQAEENIGRSYLEKLLNLK